METLANGYSSESTPRELSNEYQHEWVWMVIKNLCIFVLWMKVASALEGLREIISCPDVAVCPFTRTHLPTDIIILIYIDVMPSIHWYSINPYKCCWWLIWSIQNDAENLKNDGNPGIWVLIWEYWVRAIQWIPTWPGLDGFRKSLDPCSLGLSSLSTGRVKIFWCIPIKS